MPTSFSSQVLRDVIRDHSLQDPNKGLQTFEMRTNDVAVMKAFYDNRDGLLSPLEIKMIENLRTSDQAVDLYLYNKKAPGSGATRVRQGTGSPTVTKVTPSFFTPIQEGLDMSLINQSLRQYGSEGADKRQVISNAYSDHMRRSLPQIWRNMYTRANEQYIAFLEANIWAINSTDGTADAGTIYAGTAGSDAKQVALADKGEVIQNMQIEAQQNNFLSAGTPSLIASPRSMQIVNEYLKYGGANEKNIQQFLGWFNPYFDNGVTDAANMIATMYLIYNGGIAGYQRVFPWDSHPDAVNGVVTAGNDEWYNITIGGNDTMVFNGLPEMKIEVKAYRGYSDTSATYTIDESKIDIVSNYSFVAQFGGLKAYDHDANVSPILKYEVANA